MVVNHGAPQHDREVFALSGGDFRLETGGIRAYTHLVSVLLCVLRHLISPPEVLSFPFPTSTTCCESWNRLYFLLWTMFMVFMGLMMVMVRESF